jgi:hypothetical protein
MSTFLGTLLEQLGGVAHTVSLAVAAKAEFPGAKQRDGIDVGDGVAFERFVAAKLREASVATRRDDGRWVVAEDESDILKVRGSSPFFAHTSPFSFPPRVFHVPMMKNH